MAQTYDSNRPRTQAKTNWIAVSRDLYSRESHPIVGAGVEPPKAADPKRAAWFPVMAWQWMLAEAAFADRTCTYKGKSYALNRGQLNCAQRHLATRFNWTRSAVRWFLEQLEADGMIETSVPVELQRGQLGLELHSPGHSPGHSPTMTIITLCNYDKFQHQQRGQQPRPQPKSRPIHNKSDNRQEDSPVGPLEQQIPVVEQNRNDLASLGTDGAAGERLPFTDEALRACEAMGFTRETLVARYVQKTARRRTPVRDPSAYLIAMAVDMASKARGVPAQAIRASISRNTEERQAGHAVASGATAQPSEKALQRVTARCERRGLMVTALVAAWKQRYAGSTILNADVSLENFCQWWLDSQRAA